MNINTDKFKATVLKDMGYTTASSSLIHRVLIVRDELKRMRISVQAWWEEDGIWNPGKGYFFTPRTAVRIADLMLSERDSDPIEITNTQQYRVVKNPVDDVVSIEKWWRKSEDEPWTSGKSLAIKADKVKELARLINEAGSQTIHVR